LRVGPLVAKRNARASRDGCGKSNGAKRRVAKAICSSNGSGAKRAEHKLAKVV
jgi:hypothetical protein